MGRNDDLTGILLLLGLGYFILKGEKVQEAISGFRSSTRPGVMYSPFWITPPGWTPIPGPAYRGNGLPFLDGNGDGEEEPSPGIPGPAYRGNGLLTQIRGGAQPSGIYVPDKIKEIWEKSKTGRPIPGPASQPRWPIKIGPRRVTLPMPPGLAAQLRGGAQARIPPSPETSSFTGGEQRE